MTVNELIEELKKYPGDFPVLIAASRGYRNKTFSDIELFHGVMKQKDFMGISSNGLNEAVYELIIR